MMGVKKSIDKNVGKDATTTTTSSNNGSKSSPSKSKVKTPKSDKKEKSFSKVTPERKKTRSTSKTVSNDDHVDMEVGENDPKKHDVESPKKRKRNKPDLIDETIMPEGSDEPGKDPDGVLGEGSATTAPQPTPPILNTKVHRMRHLNFQPRAILCMSPTPHHAQACDYVAVSYEDGSVTIKSPDEKWRTLVSIAGMPNKTVDTMVWVCGACEHQAPTSTMSFYSDFHKSHTEIHSQRTLVGASKDGTLFVLDFAKGGYSAVTGSSGGGVFSMTSLCGSECCKAGKCPGLIAIGCEDGNVRIYKLNQDNLDHRLDLVSTVPVAGGSILSLAWRRYADSPGHGMCGSVMYVGVADGTIRRYECKSAVDKARSKGHIVNFEAEYGKQTWSSNSRMTVESYGRTTPTRIWVLKTLADGTVVSGDSLGHVQFWDGKTGTLLYSFEQNDQKADILALAVTPDECQVFASGIDSRVICIERPTFHESQNGPPRWIMTHAQRPHTHDVKALVVCRVHDSKGSMVRAEKPFLTLCSGGVDTKICTVLVDKFKNGRPRVWFPWPTHSPISVAKAGRIVLLRRQKSIELHQLGPQQTDSLPLILDEDKRFVGTLDITSSHNLVCSDISSDGKSLLASTGSNFLLFDIVYIENVDGTLGFTARQVKLQGESKHPCLAAKFVSVDAIVCAYSNGDVRLLKLSRSTNEATRDARKAVTVCVVDSFAATSETSNKLFAVHSLVTSDDGQFFATVRSGVGSGTVCVYTIENNKIKYHWNASATEAPVSTVGFLHGTGRQLVVACSNYAMYVFDLQERALSEWSQINGFPVSPTLPEELNRPFDFPKCVMSSPKTPEKFLLVSYCINRGRSKEELYFGASST